MLKRLTLALTLCCSTLALPIANADVTISGTLSKWHPVTLDVAGATNAMDERLSGPNPFLDFRFDVNFTSPSGEEFTVPGFFAGDGAGGGTGDIWRARFAPNETGEWQYQISFLSGTDVSVTENIGTALPIDGTNGVFTVTAQGEDDAGFLKHGRLEYVQQHYLKFADGPFWIKGGIDSPENFFGYSGFDDTTDQEGGADTSTLTLGVHQYRGHINDWSEGDPLFTNSANYNSAKGIIGAVNYLASEGVNSIYFLPMNLGGDGRDTYPFIGPNNTYYTKTHYDISKLYQWDIVLNHMQNSGIAAHIVLAETEIGNSEWLDGGELDVERKLFHREMVARFSYLLAVKWNLSEESRFGTEKHKSFAKHLRSLDWAQHPIAVHAHLNKPAEQYDELLADPSFEASSIQFSPSYANEMVETWRLKTAEAGRPWVIDMDEVGSAQTGLTTDNADSLRRSVLYPVYFSGGNIEWYFGYHPLPLGGDLRAENFRTREAMYQYMRYAREMMQQELPFWEMQPADELHSSAGVAQVFAKTGSHYAVYLPNAVESGSLEVASGTYRQRWFNPRSGSFEGTTETKSGTTIMLGDAPNTIGQDWVMLLDSDSLDTATETPPTDSNTDDTVTDSSTDDTVTTAPTTPTETPSNEIPDPAEKTDTDTDTANQPTTTLAPVEEFAAATPIVLKSGSLDIWLLFSLLFGSAYVRKRDSR